MIFGEETSCPQEPARGITKNKTEEERRCGTQKLLKEL